MADMFLEFVNAYDEKPCFVVIDDILLLTDASTEAWTTSKGIFLPGWIVGYETYPARVMTTIQFRNSEGIRVIGSVTEIRAKIEAFNKELAASYLAGFGLASPEG